MFKHHALEARAKIKDTSMFCTCFLVHLMHEYHTDVAPPFTTGCGQRDLGDSLEFSHALAYISDLCKKLCKRALLQICHDHQKE